MSFSEEWHLKFIHFHFSCGQIHGKWHLMLTNVSYFVSLRKSSVIKYVNNMYQANALSDNNSPLLALLVKKYLGFTVPSTDFIDIEETQHESYSGVIIDNKLNFNQHIDDMSKKATNLLNLCRRNLDMCSKEVKNTAYNMIVRPHLEYASTC